MPFAYLFSGGLMSKARLHLSLRLKCGRKLWVGRSAFEPADNQEHNLSALIYE